MLYCCMFATMGCGNQSATMSRSPRLSRIKKLQAWKLTPLNINVFPLSSFKYFASVKITKKGKWMKDRDTYQYNEDI